MRARLAVLSVTILAALGLCACGTTVHLGFDGVSVRFPRYAPKQPRTEPHQFLPVTVPQK